MGTDDDGGFDRRTVLRSLGATAVAGGLAGCSGLTDRRYVARPVVLPEAATEGFGYTDPTYDRLVDERSVAVGPLEGNATVESFVFTYGAGDRNGDDDGDGGGPSGGTAAPAGVLATPRVEEGGEALNPFATEPLDAIVADPAMDDLLARVGLLERADAEWRYPPERVDSRAVLMFGEERTLARYVGVTESDGGGRVVRVDVARGERGDDAVLAATGEERQLTSDERGALAGSDCETINCLDEEQTFEARTGIGEQITSQLVPCPVTKEQARREDVDLDECLEVTGGGDSMAFLHLDVSDIRVVQQVDDTVVTGASPPHEEPDPSLVDGEGMAAVFDLGRGQIDAAYDDWDTSVRVDVTRRFSGGRSSETDRFLIPNGRAKDIIEGADPVAVFHELGTTSPSATDPPVFPAETDLDSIHVSVSSQDDDDLQWGVVGDDTAITAAGNFEVETVDPLRVGFCFVADPDGGSRYGTNTGYPRDYTRTWKSATEYLQRAYPGKVVSYLHNAAPFMGGHAQSGLFVRNCTGDCVIHQDMVEARNWLNSVVTKGSFPGIGRIDRDGLSPSQVNWSGGFDVVFAIVPGVATGNSDASSYYNYHGKSSGVIGLAWSDPNAAVSALGANPAGSDEVLSSTAAQEIGHYFQDDYRGPSGHPMAQRDDASVDTSVNGVPVDVDHARHPNSDLRDRDPDGDGTFEVNNPPDPPGVLSRAFDLTDGFANVQSFSNADGSFSVTGPSASASSVGKVPSYMSYTPFDATTWGDARIHQQLIDSDWNPPGSAGGANARAMLSATGHVDDEGGVRYDNVATLPGTARYTDLDDGPVVVSLLGPSEEPLERTRVPLEVTSTHGHGDPAVAPAVTLPFPATGVRVETTVRERTTSMNPVTRSVRDAVDRVPDEGFGEDPATARDRIGAALDEVAGQMASGAYGDAATTMDGSVRDRIGGSLGEYEGALNIPTRDELLALVDRMVDRLRTVAEVA